MATGEAQDATTLQRAGGATHRFKGQSEVVGNVRSAHGQVDFTRATVLALELPDEHGQPADGVAAADDDHLPLRLAELVSQLAEKLELKFAIAFQRLDEYVDVEPIQRCVE